jgi:23S rRNA pseudouridine1911/1915/1917 synthase
VYEDHHLIGVNKRCGDLVEWDKSGDEPLPAAIERYLAATPPPAGVFVGVIHRLDRPTSGCVLYAKTQTAQRQMNALFRDSFVEKLYWAVVDAPPPQPHGTLEHYLVHDKELNKSFAAEEGAADSKLARLAYRQIGRSDRYFFLEIDLFTGRHHQIRAQLAAIGCHIKGDLKYGARRSNPAGGIHLHARSMRFTHPIRAHTVEMVARPPRDTIWDLVLEGESEAHDTGAQNAP